MPYVWVYTLHGAYADQTMCRAGQGMLKRHAKQLPYSGYFSGGKIFVSSEFLASLWKNFRGHGIVCVRTPNYVALFRG